MIPLFKVFMAQEANEFVGQVLQSGFVGQGPKVEAFENLLRGHFGNPYVNTLNSATSGLHLAVHIVKTGDEYWHENDEILTTPLSCTATNWTILANGVKLRWVDVDPDTGNMDLDDLSRKLSPHTKAIMVVHWSGYAVDLDRLSRIQRRCEELHGFRPQIIEDCAHAWGATYKGRLLGNHGNICVFSFQAIKHLTTVDGGLFISPTAEMHERARLLRWYGLDRTSSVDFRCDQDVAEYGFKFHMNDVSASIGLANYPHVGKIVERHRENGEFYDRALAATDGVKLLVHRADRQSSHWVYTLKVQNRDGFMAKMKEFGIAVSRVHDRNDKHACVRQFQSPLPNLDRFSKEMVCIPCGWWVSEEDREFIADCINRGW